MRLHRSTALLAARSGWSGCGQRWSPNVYLAPAIFVQGRDIHWWQCASCPPSWASESERFEMLTNYFKNHSVRIIGADFGSA
jgi:hypothetical protein